MKEVHVFGVKEGQYKIHGNRVSVFNDKYKDWHDYEITRGFDICPVCDEPLQVLAIKGSTFIATCCPKHSIILLRREKENLCIRCGTQFPPNVPEQHSAWYCQSCYNKRNDAHWQSFNIRKRKYEIQHNSL